MSSRRWRSVHGGRQSSRDARRVPACAGDRDRWSTPVHKPGIGGPGCVALLGGVSLASLRLARL